MNSTVSQNRTAANPAYPRGSYQTGEPMQPLDDLVEYATNYVRQNPGTAALWCFGLGFIVGWRLKPW